jgi:peptide chain release factor subunit 1
MSAVSDITEQALRELAQLKDERQSVLSFYLDLDPSEFATEPARASAINSLLDRAHKEIEGEERPHEELQALRAAFERAEQVLRDERWWAQGARGLALFVSEPLGLERALRLAHPVASEAVIADAPFIAPLAEAGIQGRVCVALVDERFARILRGSEDTLREAISFGDEVHGRHDQGGWSQARYQRSRHEEADAHLRHVARVLRDLLRVAPYDRLLIACTEPLWPRMLAALPAEVRERLYEERLSLDVGDATVQQALDAAKPLLEAERRAREEELLQRLRERHGRDGDERVAIGMSEVLSALVERRVDALLYDEGLQAAGVLCPRCGWMDTSGERCPVDDGELDERQDILQDALQSAINQSSEILALRDRPDLGPLGGVAATLRF